MSKILEVNYKHGCSTNHIQNLAADLEYLNPKIGSLVGVKDLFLGGCHFCDAYYRFLDSNENYGIHQLISAIKNELVDLLINEPYYVCFANKSVVVNDYLIMSEIAKVNGFQAVLYASDELKRNPQFAKIAVGNYGLGLGHFPNSIKNNKEVVLTAISETELAFPFASEYLKHDLDVVSLAAKKGLRMKLIPDDCQTYEVVKSSVISWGENIHGIKNSYKNNPEIIFLALANGGNKTRISQIPIQKCLPTA
jgi:hypothetical protein